MQAKSVELPFEDEKFSYVVLTRVPPARRFSRVLSKPAVGKAEISAKLCTPHGLEFAKVPRRDKTAYGRARRWRWGDLATD
jgi:ribosomal protein RSM22 (predicted rRNA methylase)